MPREMKVQGGKILLWRLGDLNYSEQRHDAAPRGEFHGLWAFPWPYFDLFFAYHKFEVALPKRFKTSYGNVPLHDRERWLRVHEEDGVERPLTALEMKEVEEWLAVHDNSDCYERLPAPFTIVPEFWVERDHWMATTGKRIVPLRKFYYSGTLYSRLGNLSHDDSWTRMGAMEFVREVKRCRGVAQAGRMRTGCTTPGQEYSFTKANNIYSVDHLEVFLPRGKGEITGKP